MKAGMRGLAKLAKFAVDQFGYPYDKGDIARIAARIFAAKVPFSPAEMRWIKTDKEFICSEYVALCCETLGLNIPWDHRGFMAPADFARDDGFELVGVLKKSVNTNS